jgi:hypothetical protein
MLLEVEADEGGHQDVVRDASESLRNRAPLAEHGPIREEEIEIRGISKDERVFEALHQQLVQKARGVAGRL